MSSSSGKEPGATDNTTNSNPGSESLRIQVRLAAREVESRIIKEALEQHHWNRRRTAEALQISYRSLMYKMKTCHLRDSDSVPERQN